jgi:methyl-accepting chemotaxis protein
LKRKTSPQIGKLQTLPEIHTTQRILRRNFIIERNFQLKYAFLLSVIGGMVSLTLGAVIYYFIRENYDLFLSSGLTTSPNVVNHIQREQRFLAVILVSAFIFLMIFLTVLGIFITHRIAGPVFTLRRALQKIAGGDYSPNVKLRKDDEFRTLEESFNFMMTSLRERTNSIITTLEASLETLKSRDDFDPKSDLAMELESQIKSLKNSLSTRDSDKGKTSS